MIVLYFLNYLQLFQNENFFFSSRSLYFCTISDQEFFCSVYNLIHKYHAHILPQGEHLKTLDSHLTV